MRPIDSFNYYDVESLENVFTVANYKEKENHLDIYILADDPKLIQPLPGEPPFIDQVLDRVYQKNHNFNGTLSILWLDTKPGCEHLARTFGLSSASMVNDPNAESEYPSEFRPVCDTDENYDPGIHPYLCGYNSTNYDTTIIAAFLDEVFYLEPMEPDAQHPDGWRRLKFQRQTAHFMRRNVNDVMFSDKFKDQMPSFLAIGSRGGRPNYQARPWRIRKNMLFTGRQVDLSVLNEKQRKVGLKRLLGMMGFQILESDKLGQGQDTLENKDQLLDLIAYNVSDVVNLKELSKLDLYKAQFSLKRQMLRTYPEMIYEKKPDKYEPDIRPDKVRRDRLYIDSTSSQLAQKALCPYGHLKDIQAVSFNYPHPDKAKELGIPVVNVLEETKKFFYKLFPQPEVRAQFDNIYNYYKSIEGKNFNESNAYLEDFGEDALDAYKISDIPKLPSCIPYFDKDGKPTSGFAAFSTGGVHGAEYNKELFEFDHKYWTQFKADIEHARSVCPDAAEFKQKYGAKPKEVTLLNDVVVKTATVRAALKQLDKFDSYAEALQKIQDLTKLPEDKSIAKAVRGIASNCMYDADKLDLQQVMMVASQTNPKLRIDFIDEVKCKPMDVIEGIYYLSTPPIPLQRALDAALLSKTLKGKTLENTVMICDAYGWNENALHGLVNLLNKEPGFLMPDGSLLPISYFTKASKDPQIKTEWKNPADCEPEIFKKTDDGALKLNPKYAYTSADPANHEDFTSYYPNLLRMMMAFYNAGLGYDRYAEIFQQKQDYGTYMKDKNRPEAERDLYAVLREGTKLVLNSASGAGDATFDNNIRVNNKIISMRVIG